MSNVQPYALMAGVPAKQIGWVCECGQVLAKNLDASCTCPDCGRHYRLSDNTLEECKVEGLSKEFSNAVQDES